jgi:hypothetical protein
MEKYTMLMSCSNKDVSSLPIDIYIQVTYLLRGRSDKLILKLKIYIRKKRAKKESN